MNVYLETFEVNLSAVGEVVGHDAEAVLVDLQQHVDTALSDGQAGHVRQEIVAHEEAEEHEVIDDPLEVVAEGNCCAHVV